ncbi:MAG: hypothetical protein RLY70_540 [Planctomycetota bacterium]|jgi:hypothetical protein
MLAVLQNIEEEDGVPEFVVGFKEPWFDSRQTVTDRSPCLPSGWS